MDECSLPKAPALMQRLSRLPTTPHVALLHRRKPKPFPLDHKHHLWKQLYSRWCCIDRLSSDEQSTKVEVSRGPYPVLWLSRQEPIPRSIRSIQFGWMQGLRKSLKGKKFWLRGPDLNLRVPLSFNWLRVILPEKALAHEVGASAIRLSLGPAFSYEPKAPLLSPIFLGHKSQLVRPITTTVGTQSPTRLLRFYDSAKKEVAKAVCN